MTSSSAPPPRAAERTTAQVMRQLVPSVYVPTLLEFSGNSALMPVVPLMALSLGFGVPQAAALSLVFGIFSFIGPIPAARLISRCGARASLVATGVVLVLSNVVAYLLITPGLSGDPTLRHRVALLVALVVMAACSQVWTLGRQAYLGSTLPPSMRARGMTTFGGMIRIGQVVGPLLGAALLGLGQDSIVFLLYAVTTAAATVMVGVFLPIGERREASRAVRSSAGRSPLRRRLDRAVLVRMISIGCGIAPVMISRVNRPVIVPLLGAALGLDSTLISLVFGASAVLEILMVIPAGVLMDRFGRAAVAVPCGLTMGVGYVLLAVLAQTLGGEGQTAALVALLVPSALIALGNGLGSGIVMTLGIDVSPVHGRTGYLAWWNTLMGAGRLVAPLVVSGVTLVAPVAAAGAAPGVLCLAGGLWLLRALPRLTPSGGTRAGAVRTVPAARS